MGVHLVSAHHISQIVKGKKKLLVLSLKMDTARIEEKGDMVHLEYQDGRGLFPEDQEFLANFSNEARQKVLRKVRDMESL